MPLASRRGWVIRYRRSQMSQAWRSMACTAPVAALAGSVALSSASVSGEEGGHAGVGLGGELGIGERPIAAEEALVERTPEDEEGEVGGRNVRVGQLEQAPAG